jgi:hypothetical protein
MSGNCPFRIALYAALYFPFKFIFPFLSFSCNSLITLQIVLLFPRFSFLPLFPCLRAVPWLKRLVAGLSPRSPGFAPGSIHVGFVVGNVALGQVFPCQYNSTVVLHTHILSVGWTICPLVAAVQRRSLTPFFSLLCCFCSFFIHFFNFSFQSLPSLFGELFWFSFPVSMYFLFKSFSLCSFERIQTNAHVTVKMQSLITRHSIFSSCSNQQQSSN